MNKIYTQTWYSPIGPLLLIASDRALIHLDLKNMVPPVYKTHPLISGNNNLLETACIQLQEYFTGIRKDFTIKLSPAGSAFQMQVWAELQKIPYGQTISYRELAAKIGDIRKTRAVGGANGRNPLPIIIPCHRVISSNGSLGGYSGGLDTKRYLLQLEGLEF